MTVITNSLKRQQESKEENQNLFPIQESLHRFFQWFGIQITSDDMNGRRLNGRIGGEELKDLLDRIVARFFK
jgi:hypothetical protein